MLFGPGAFGNLWEHMIRANSKLERMHAVCVCIGIQRTLGWGTPGGAELYWLRSCCDLGNPVPCGVSLSPNATPIIPQWANADQQERCLTVKQLNYLPFAFRLHRRQRPRSGKKNTPATLHMKAAVLANNQKWMQVLWGSAGTCPKPTSPRNSLHMKLNTPLPQPLSKECIKAANIC